MTDPFEDGWGDLAAELGVERPKPVWSQEPPSLPDVEPAPTDLSAVVFDAVLPDAAEDGNDTEVIEAPESAEISEGDADRKRRRRRRRKKKEPIGDAPDGEAENGKTGEDVDDGITQPSELLKDIIRNWDVPGWDEIIGGLYRPHR